MQSENHADRELHHQFNLLLSRLDEQQRRWMVALESKKIGHGGDRFMAAVSGLSVETIRRGRLATITVTFTTGDLPKIAAKPSRIHKALNRAWDGLSSEISWAAIALIVASPFLLLAALLALLVRSRRRREERRLLEQ